ncbi:hypothetical protein RHSIM_Rhsim01G0138300 [Rhododendron simsii]|uniref:Uncharacterized protein n=1 Tax=Rhododendron simsii TaxID=118357 RepID=A0A834HUM0_RHOSS|nr:hypothetical protein RHSIM_Rhsim01G0138300 [Rhododendron simsii]
MEPYGSIVSSVFSNQEKLALSHGVQIIDDLIMKTKTTTFFLVLFVTLLMTRGPLQADAEEANYRRLLSDGWKYDDPESNGDTSHHHTTDTEPPDTWVKKRG